MRDRFNECLSHRVNTVSQYKQKKKPALTEVQRPTPAMTLTFDLLTQIASTEVGEVSRIVKLSVNWGSDDFAAGSKNSEKYFLMSAENRRCSFTFLRTWEDDVAFGFRWWEKILHFKIIK